MANNSSSSTMDPNVLGSIINGGTNLLSLILGSSQAKKERQFIEEQNKLSAELAIMQGQQNLTILKTQADLQDDAQEAQQKNLILVGVGIVGIMVLVIIVIIIKALVK